MAGLKLGPYPGAPRKLTEKQECELVQVVAYQTPHEVGYESKYTWTLAMIADFIQREWSQQYTLRGVSGSWPELHLAYVHVEESRQAETG